ncbi:unnamed protein product [Rotaria sordida]|uniref:B30.2/SPRY domain-containing protein n=1 Tax=Rotaria sordida TaxID=392033 RepID=A0A814ZZH4_9BILA|nr:unnamed protein product [Rotaria sordida]
MGQQLSNINLKASDAINKYDTEFSHNTIISRSGHDNIHLFSCIKGLDGMTTSSIGFDQISSSHIDLIKKIQRNLSLPSHAVDITEVNSEINKILITDVFPLISLRYKSTIEEILAIMKKQQQLKLNIYLKQKLEENENVDQSISVESFHDDIDTFAIKDTINNVDIQESNVAEQKLEQDKIQAQQATYFAVRSLTSLLLILIKSAEKNDPIIVEELLTLAIQLCDQMPMNCFNSSDLSAIIDSHWFKSLQPLINYMNELSLSTNTMMANKAMKILLSFSIAKASFKDILPILRKLVFNKVHVYNVRRLFFRLNNSLVKTLNKMEKKKQQQQQNDGSSDKFEQDTDDDKTLDKSTDYLQTIGTFPNSRLIQLDEKEFTGPYVASVILAHTDFYNRTHSIEQFEHGSIDSSISFEFHPNTFEQLFHIIEQLTATKIEDSNIVDIHILTVCLRLFATHLKFLLAVTSTLDRDLLLRNHQLRTIIETSSTKPKSHVDFTTFASDNQLNLWFDLLLKLVCNDNDESFEQTTICQEASQALIYIIEKKVSSFTEKLTIFHTYIIENKYPLLIEQIFVELKKNLTLLSWIEVFFNDDNETSSDKRIASQILYSFIDIYLNLSNDIDLKRKEQIKEILLIFQELLLVQLISPSRMENIQNNDTTKNELNKFSFSHYSTSFITNYLTHILNISIDNDLLNSIFVGLCLMTQTEKFFNFDTIQPIFTTMLPILAEYLLKNTIYMKNNLYSICWLIGKMSNIMIIGPEQNLLEIKHTDKLKSPLFTGGCEKIIIEKNKYLFNLYESNLAIYSQFKLDNQIQQLSSMDNEFLMSIYNNIDQGAQLISKMKMYVKDRQFVLQTIEHEANDACAALFAVYIKHYHRIDLAKKELSRMDNEKPHNKLLSIYEYANNIKILFTETKTRGDNVTELYQQFKMNTLFLLLNVKETNLIPIIEEDKDLLSESILINTQSRKRSSFQRQISRWTKVKYVVRLLRNTMQACIRFKKLILARKQTNQDNTIERQLNRLIDGFVYGVSDEMTTSMTSEEKQLKLDELSQCMSRYYERAMTRLITYRFIQKFIEKLLDIEDQDRIMTILNLYLPHLRNSDEEWSYLENILATNNQIKEQISQTYYSIIQILFCFIIQFVSLKPKLLVENMFNLLSLSYQSLDINYLNQDQFIETLFISFVGFANESNHIISLDTKLTAYNWFRFYVFKLCENIELNEMKSTSNKIGQQQQKFIFNTLILNELKALKQLKQSVPIDVENDSVENRKFSLNNPAIDWFIHAVTTVENDTSIHSRKLLSKFEIELYTNQLLICLLRCICLYDNVQLICANVDYIEELLYIYHSSKNHITNLLSLKILHNIISLLPENETATIIMKNLLDEFLLSIGNNFTKQNMTSETINELINIYRIIISIKSPWQMMAIQFVYNSIISCVNEIKMKSLKIIDTIEMNHVFASLSILGGSIPQYYLGTIVRVYPDTESNEFDLALIIDINPENQNSDSSEVLPYFIQYLQTNKTEWIAAEKLQIQVDNLPLNLFISTNINDSNTIIHSLLDALGYIIQIDTSTTESLILLELKRRSMSSLDYLLNDKKLVEIFMEKPYASVIAKLSMHACVFKKHLLPTDLRLFNQKHLEKYCLSLDASVWSNEIIETENDNYTISNNDNQSFQSTTIIQNPDDTLLTVWNHDEFNQNSMIVDALSISALKYNGWKPYASKSEIKSFEHGRIGDKEISIVSIPRNSVDSNLLEECGDKHRFKGKINLTTGRLFGVFPTFIVDDLQLTEGKWYYCVRLPDGGFVPIGWSTTGLTANSSANRCVGDDKYSWSYEGSRGILFNGSKFELSSEEIRWKKDDICGCGIEIDGENTRIKYWLNGKFLGTFFEHQSNIGTSTTKCNMLPHGHTTSYFPAVSVQVPFLSVGSFEFIFSPEDMTDCPLPDGYKPLLVPKLIDIENSIVPYPYRAYLVSYDMQNYVHRRRSTTSTTVLCDLINDYHLDTSYTLDNNQLLLPKDSSGFPLSIVDHQSSLTISFDFEILNTTSDHTNEQFDIELFTLETTESFSVRIPLNKIDNPTRIAIVICSPEQKIKIYFNNLCQTIHSSYEIQTMTNFNFHILPNIDARIKNLGIWNHALSEEYIRRLFTYGLFYVAVDYIQLKEYRKQANTFIFSKNQRQLENELIIPFSEPFEENLWEQKKKQIDIDESKYFKTIDETNESTIQLFGNKTYLVLTKSIEQWSEYTLILDISIPSLPAINEHLTIFLTNLESRLYITHSGRICLFSNGQAHKSKTILKLNEYMRLVINVRKNHVEVYINGILQICANVDCDQFVITTNRIDLFREIDLMMNTTNDEVLRIECKSITLLNRSIGSNIINEQMKSPNDSLASLIAPPFSIIASNLIAIGYKEEWIKFVIKEYNTTNIQFIDTIIREKKEKFFKLDYDNERKRNSIILSRLNPLIEQDKWLSLGNISEFDSNDKIMTIGQLMCDYENSTQTSKSMMNDSNNIESDHSNQPNENREVRFEKDWYQQTVYGLHIPESIFEWMNDTSSKTTLGEIYQILDLRKSEQQFITGILDQRKIIHKSSQYSHKQISRKQYFDSRCACEHGLISIYARNTILNMLKVWSNNDSNLFPLEKLGDYTFIVKLLRLLDYYYTYRSTNRDDVDRITQLIHSILQLQTKELIKQITLHKEITIKILQSKAPLLYELQKDIIIQLIQFILKPSSLLDKSHNEESTIIDEEMIIKQPNLNFIFKILNVFVKLATDKSMKQYGIDSFLPLLFRSSFINLMFDLFLLLRNHQSKIFILHLFITLIRASKTINLNARSQKFLVHLFIELSLFTTSMSCPIIRTLQTAVMDLTFLFLQRQRSQDIITTEQLYDKFEFKLPEFPKNFRNLLTVMNVINVLIDKNKHKQYLKQFSDPSYNIVDGNLEITQDDIQNSNTYFDATADLQLIKLMNEHPSMDDSLNQFISDLPTESTPDLAAFYKNYQSLLNIPRKCIQTRATFFYQFNILVESIVSTLDFSLLPGQSVLVDYIRMVKKYLLQKRKFEWLEKSLSITEIESTDKLPEVKFDTVKASIGDNEENTMFNQAFEQLHENAHIIFRRDDERLWRAKYLGLHSIDQGGPYRDSITAICSDICSTRLPLFILCPNGQTNNGFNRDCWIPIDFPPNKPIPKKFKQQYQFIGQLIGMAIRKKHYLNVKLPILLWNHLIYEEITIEDIEEIDIQSFSTIKKMENHMKQNQSIDSDIDYICNSVVSDLRFDITISSGQTYELIPGGHDIPVTANNYKEYCTRYREYRLNEFHRQIEYIRQGLCSVMPIDFLTLLTADELEQAACGKGEIDVLLLKRNTIYHGDCNENSPHIQRFWIVLGEMFDETQKKLFLRFVWGRTTLPRQDKDFTSKFRIQTIFPNDNQVADKMLPRSHTCFFTLDLPEYSTTDIMYERLNYAFTNCPSIDGDGIMNDVINPTDFTGSPDAVEQLPAVVTTFIERDIL